MMRQTTNTTANNSVNNNTAYYQWDEEESLEKQSYTWTELKDLERQRRDILKRTELGFWKILQHYHGTCLGLLVSDLLLWITGAIYASIRVAVHLGSLPAFVANIGEASNIDIIGGFLSFLLVFFVNQSNNRFNESFKLSTECTRRIIDVASLASTAMDSISAHRLVRYLNAAHAAGYVGLSHTYTKQEFFDRLNQSYRLLTSTELDYIELCDMDHKGDCFREIVNWAMMDVQTAETTNVIDPRFAGTLREKILSFRAAMDSIYDSTSQPIHFFYIHFISLLTAIYLPIFAISSAYSAGTGNEVHWSSDFLCGIIVLLQAIFVIGLRLLGQKMLDAYGDDLEDLSVLHYVRDSWKTSNRLLDSRFPTSVSQQEEEDILQASSGLVGHPWDLRHRRTQADPVTSRGGVDDSIV